MRRKISLVAVLVVSLLVVSSMVGLTLAHAVSQSVIEGAKKEGKFVWYTSMPTDPAVAYLDAFHKKYPFLDISEFWRSTSFKCYSRLNIEIAAGKYICDAAHVALVPAYMDWKEKGWLMKYDSPAYDGYPKEIMDRGYWGPMRTFAMPIVYNTTTIPPDEVPRRWSDLTDSKWKGQIGFGGSDSGSQWQQYYALNKILGASLWEQIAKNKKGIYPGMGAMMTALLRGEIKIAMDSYGYGVYRYRELEGAPIEGVWPEEGVPIRIAPLAIMKSAPHPNAAKLFLDWALSKEGQTKMVELVGAYSGRSDVPSPKGNPLLTEFKPLYIEDWEDYIATQEEFREFWQSKIE